MGLRRVGSGRELLNETINLSQKYGISGYDAAYAASAALMDGIWLTADRRAHNKLKEENLSELIE